MTLQTNPGGIVGGEIERLLTVQEAADILAVSRNWIHRHATGRGVLLPSIKVGKFRRFRRADIDVFISHCEALAADAVRKIRRAA